MVIYAQGKIQAQNRRGDHCLHFMVILSTETAYNKGGEKKEREKKKGKKSSKM